MVEQLWKLHCNRKRTPLMEEAHKMRKESDRNWGKARVNSWRVLQCCVKVCPLADVLLLTSVTRDKTSHIYTRSVNNKTWLLIIKIKACVFLSFHCTEIRVSRLSWDFYVFFLLLDSSQTASSSHVAISVEPPVIPQKTLWEGEVETLNKYFWKVWYDGHASSPWASDTDHVIMIVLFWVHAWNFDACHSSSLYIINVLSLSNNPKKKKRSLSSTQSWWWWVRLNASWGPP